MELAALRRALLDHALDSHMGLLEDRFNVLTLSVLGEAFPSPLYAVATRYPLHAARSLRDLDYRPEASSSSTLITGPSPHRRSLSGLYYESDGGVPFGFPTGERQRASLESVNSRGEVLDASSLKKPDFAVLSFDRGRVEPRVLVELKIGIKARDSEALNRVLDQILQQVKAAVALTGVRPVVFLVEATMWRHVRLPRVVDNSTGISGLRLSDASFDSLDPGIAAALRYSGRHLPA